MLSKQQGSRNMFSKGWKNVKACSRNCFDTIVTTRLPIAIARFTNANARFPWIVFCFLTRYLVCEISCEISARKTSTLFSHGFRFSRFRKSFSRTIKKPKSRRGSSEFKFWIEVHKNILASACFKLVYSVVIEMIFSSRSTRAVRIVRKTESLGKRLTQDACSNFKFPISSENRTQWVIGASGP